MADYNPYGAESPVSINSDEDDESFLVKPAQSRKGCPSILKRHILCGMSFLGFFFVYCLRVNLSVALVAMVNLTAESHANETSECPHEITDNTTTPAPPTTQGEFNWTPEMQGIILGSFFYGYILTQIPGGWIAEKYGGKIPFGAGVLCTSVLTLVTPIAARTSWILLVVVRILEGIGEGVTFPAMHAIWGRWAPPLERSKLGSITYSGAHMGTVVSMPLSGLLCQYGFDGGWPSVFYIFGSVSCVWCLVWFILIHDTPASHPTITAEEKHYIESTLGHIDGKKYTHPPWKDIFKSMPNYAILVTHMCNNWGFYTLLTCLPTYMKEVLHFDIKKNSFLSAVPYLVFWVLAICSGQIADYLRFKGILSTTTVRKIFNTLGLGLPVFCLIGLSFVKCNTTEAVLVLTLAVSLNSATIASAAVNHLDIAAVYAGTLMGISNSFATIPGMVGPYVVGLLTNDDQTRGQWQIVFYIAAGIYAFGALFYVIFGSGETQYWNSDEDRERHNRSRLDTIQGVGGAVYQPLPTEDSEYVNKYD
ncbi:sialin-like isoform X5 [Tubulanus polymorphus]|uniref:sialin-like isoform X5 n=1 Tax=Tubulanus polymorphus TaxID=672921 RepID=UPI003DA3190B